MPSNPKTVKWKPLEHALARWLRDQAGNDLSFCAGFTAIPGFKSDGFRADGILTDGKSLLGLEVECRQNHPDTNVGKFWLLQKTHPYKKMVLIHVFTPAYDSYGSRLELCRFYAAKMKSDFNFTYIMFDHRKATSFDAAFNEVVASLDKQYRNLFLHRTNRARASHV
jgi:hypothetical protein